MENLQDSYTLYNGCKIPCIGYGTGKMPEGDATVESVAHALETGYRHIDTASAYDNERSIGKAVAKCGIARNDLFVTSKLWNKDRGYDKVLAAFETTLLKLGLDYLDLYLIHWPAAQGPPEEWAAVNADTWSAFERLYREGVVKTIGVSNFKERHLGPLMVFCDIKPMVNQIECHPGFPQAALREFCTGYDMLVEAWSPLGSGEVLGNDTLKMLSEKYGCSVAQLCIRWCLQNRMLPLPKSADADRMRENADVFWFEISADDLASMNALPEFGFSGLDPDTVKF